MDIFEHTLCAAKIPHICILHLKHIMPIITRIRTIFNLDRRPAQLSEQFIDELGLYQAEYKHYPEPEQTMMHCLPESDAHWWSQLHHANTDSLLAMHHAGH